MAHEIFGERFVSYREPAWHALGDVVQEPISAEQAFRRTGAYEVSLKSLMTDDGLPIPYRAIVRNPTEDDPQHRVFGVVSEEYTLITPWDFVRLWDEHVAQPIETFGVLRNGSNLFISTFMEEFDIKGDPVKNYLLAVSPMTGSDSAEIRVTPIRVVCQNTLSLSARHSSEVYRIIHDYSAKERMGQWLSNIYQRAVDRAAAIKEAFEIMATHRVQKDELNQVIEKAYPLKRRPGEDAPEEVVERRLGRWESRNEMIQMRREAAIELFKGAGTGLDNSNIAGSAWALYNAVVEVEDYRRGRSLESICEDTLVGKRAATKERAFEACLQISQN